MAQHNFWAFCIYYDYEFFFKKRKFLHKIAIIFQKVVDEYRQGNAISVKVSMPPRAGKSYITSLFAAYWLGNFPELSIMRNSCTSRLYDKFSYDTRAIIRSEKFNDVFPDIKLSPDKQNLAGWNLTTSKQVAYFGAGVGGTIIGFGANIAISDDLYKDMKDAMSSTTNENIKQWKESAHDSRMEKNCPEIFIGTRWSKKDVIGEAVTDYEVVIPALNDKDKSFCEDVKSTEEYHKIRNKIEPSIWNAEYMQEPLEIKGLLLPKSNIKFADLSFLDNLDPKHVLLNFAFLDPADKGGDNFAVPFCKVCYIENQLRVYVYSAIYSKTGTESTCERITDRAIKHKIEQTHIEINGLGLAAYSLLKKSLPEKIKLMAYNQRQNKEVRILGNYEFIQQYFTFSNDFLNIDDNELVRFINDLTAYTSEGDNKHIADAIDSLSAVANFVKLKYRKLL